MDKFVNFNSSPTNDSFMSTIQSAGSKMNTTTIIIILVVILFISVACACYYFYIVPSSNAMYRANKELGPKCDNAEAELLFFYADWCPPCRQLSPLVEEIAKEFNGRIVVYKVNTDKEKLLAQSLGITNLPTLLYIPAKGNPKVTLGYITKEKIVKTINEVLLIK